ncbi:MAG: DUF87 domain-containing protein [Anaerolineae bacterium]|nr:MAG: DUF87 domain-containing protein [Anaerolineae bacterium]
MKTFEKLGVFYLGKRYDLKAGEIQDELVLYDSKDLTTHAAVIGMTGSGKTGLCIGLIEEAAIDGIPAILIDPKGDLSNLALTFPQLRPEDFRPWVNPDAARQKGLSLDEYARKQAELWSQGIASWGQDGARIQRLKDAAEVLIFTPGSNAGIPVSILDSLSAPAKAILEDADLLRERIQTTVTSLLGLLGIEADPIKSREHVLLSNIFENAWRAGQSLDLPALIQQVQKPPVQKIGVLDVETFYPESDRFELVMALNNLLGSPGFDVWLEGVPLDIQEILYTPEGKPRIAIFSIAHLNDAERMFFVALLLNQVLNWMRGQPGTTSLRALVYMDEIYGYLPPTKNPPSKQPMMTLLKQARAFGVGIILATQNPVDLDYKALSNTGTWFIGRLQTQRDKERLLDGLESLHAAAMTRKELEKTISNLDSRVFLLNNTHEDVPEIFHTRWVLSYLPGPLTRDQIKVLMDPVRSRALQQSRSAASPSAPASATPPPVQPVVTPVAGAAGAQPPTLPSGVAQYFLPVRGIPNEQQHLLYAPYLFGEVNISFVDKKYHLDLSERRDFITPLLERPIPVKWEEAIECSLSADDLESVPAKGARFAPLPAAASKKSSYTAWEKDFKAWLYGSQELTLFFSPSLEEVSQPGENERDFRLRMSQLARERRDEAVEALRKKYASKFTTLKNRLLRAEQKLEKQKSQAQKAKMDTMISAGAALLSAFTGRKALSSTTLSKASSAMRGITRTMDESQDIKQAEETVEAVKQQIADLETEFQAEVEKMEERIDPMSEELEQVIIKPRKSDLRVALVTLVWAPFFENAEGEREAAW